MCLLGAPPPEPIFFKAPALDGKTYSVYSRDSTSSNATETAWKHMAIALLEESVTLEHAERIVAEVR